MFLVSWHKDFAYFADLPFCLTTVDKNIKVMKASVVLHNFFPNGNDEAESRYHPNFAESNDPFGERLGDWKR